MRILIAGMDGYLGWSLAQHLTQRGHTVGGADALYRRSWVKEMGSVSAIPISSIEERLQALREHSGQEVPFWGGDLRDYALVRPNLPVFRARGCRPPRRMPVSSVLHDRP